MPSSWNHVIPVVCDQLEKLQPKRVLDIGTGYGKYGFLAREYGHAEHVDGVEGEERYITKIQEAIYDHLYIFDIRDHIQDIAETYDLVLFIDCIEHMYKEDGHRILKHFKCPILVSTPDMDFGQIIPGCPLEDHVSRWYEHDFNDYPHERIADPKGQALIVKVNP